MLQFSITGLYLIIFFKTAVAQDISDYASVVAEDIPPNVYCNNQNLTWDNARRACENANGAFMPFESGLGMDVANLSLTDETDIWTADYAWEPIAKGLNAFLGRRDSVNCPDIHVRSTDQHLPSGFYWTSSIVNVITDTWPSLQVPWYPPVLCGAYKQSIGKYFGDCKTKRVSLCKISMYAATGTYRNSFDKSCFDNWQIRSTQKAASKTPQSTHAVLNTMPQSTVMQRKTSLKIVATPIVTTATKTTDAMPHVAKSLYPGTVASRGDGRSDKQSENYSNVGVTVGLPVGLGIVVICGIILSIFLIRRYKRKLNKRSPEGEYDVITPNFSSSNHIYNTLQSGHELNQIR